MLRKTKIFIPSITIDVIVLKAFILKIIEIIEIHEKLVPKINLKLIGEEFITELNVNDFENFYDYRGGLHTIELLISIKKKLKFFIMLTSLRRFRYLRPPPSYAHLETLSLDIESKLVNYLNDFFQLNRNHNLLINHVGKYFSLFFSFQIVLLISVNIIPYVIANEGISIVFFIMILFFTFLFARTLRNFIWWLFPPAYFKGENVIRDRYKFQILLTFIITFIALFLYLINITNFFSNSIL